MSFRRIFIFKADIFLFDGHFVTFVQVRELSPNEAVDALMARLSYSASIRAEVATRRCAEKLSSLETMKVAATFSLLVLFFSSFHLYEINCSFYAAVVFRQLQLSSCVKPYRSWTGECFIIKQ